MGQEVWVGSRYPNGLMTGQQALGTPMGCSMGQMQLGSRYPNKLTMGHLKLLVLISCSTGQEVGEGSRYPKG